MKACPPLLLVAAVAIATVMLGMSPAGSASPPTTAAPTTTVPTSSRPFEVHVPPGYTPAVPAPLLVMLHGYGANGALESLYLKLTSATDAHGMIYVAPDGTLDKKGRRFWNATNACCNLYGAKVDDSTYLDGVIKQVEASYNVDPHRIFLLGHSNGGFMAYRMACNHADEVAAIVSLEAATFAAPGRCAPSRPVATLEIHGTADRTIRYKGGTIKSRRYPGAVTTVRTWAKYDGCRVTPDNPEPGNHLIELGRPPATVQSYSTGCAPGGHAELWTQNGGVHAPKLTESFAEQVVDFLLAHPKP